MRRTASEVLRTLESRIARLERQADPYLDQYSQSEQARDERADERRRKMQGPSHAEMLYGVMASEYKMDIDMLDSAGNASIKIPIPPYAMKDEDALASYLTLKADDHFFRPSRKGISITKKSESKFTLAFSYKLDRSGFVVIYYGRSLH